MQNPVQASQRNLLVLPVRIVALQMMVHTKAFKAEARVEHKWRPVATRMDLVVVRANWKVNELLMELRLPIKALRVVPVQWLEQTVIKVRTAFSCFLMWQTPSSRLFGGGVGVAARSANSVGSQVSPYVQ